MTKRTGRRSYILRLIKVERFLEQLPTPEDEAAQKALVTWRKAVRETKLYASGLGRKHNVSTPLAMLGLNADIRRKLASYRVNSVETLANIDTRSLRELLRYSHDKLTAVILIKLHPDSSAR